MERYHCSWVVVCHSLDVPWLKWWSRSWSASPGGSTQNTEFSGLHTSRFRWECPTIFPGGGELYIVWCYTVEHGSPPMEGSRNECGETAGVFNGLWHLPRHDSCLTSVYLTPSEGMPQYLPSLDVEGLSQLCKGRLWQDKKYYPTSRVQTLPQQSTLLALQMAHCFE